MRNTFHAPGTAHFKPVFRSRSIEHWRTALMTLPDRNFFELLRSVFGNIKTPFSKQKLLDDLFVFLSRKEIQKVIAAYINEQDHKVIAAVALLNEPAPGDLESFFTGELSYAELHAIIINLEERLILYRFEDTQAVIRRSPLSADRVLRITLNPVLEKILSPFINDNRLLFPCFYGDSESPEKDIKPGSNVPPESKVPINLNDNRALAALFTFIQCEEEHFRTESGMQSEELQFYGMQFRKIRKKFSDEGKKFFPGIDFELTVRIVILLELFRREGRCLLPCNSKLAGFSKLTSRERQVYWAAGLYLCLNEDRSGSSVAHNDTIRIFSRGILWRIAVFIHRFMNIINPGRNTGSGLPRMKTPEIQYPKITLRRLFEFIEMENDITASGNIPGSIISGSTLSAVPAGDTDMQINYEYFLSAMEQTGLLEKAEGCWKAGRHECYEERNTSVIAMDTAFSFILYPEISLSDALALGSFCLVRENSVTAVSFELTRTSVVRGFDRGMTAQSMMKLLVRLSGDRIDENLGWTLSEWENRYAGVSLHQGVILTLAEDRRYLAEAEPVASLIRQIIAPGVYLLSSEERSDAANALKKAGVDIIAQPPVTPDTAFNGSGASYGSGVSYENETWQYNSFPPLVSAEDDSHEAAASIGSDALSASSLMGYHENESAAFKEAESIQENFHGFLDKMKLGKTEREELSARIERRLVLSEAQLERTTLRFEKLEARGLDYTGKSLIARQAIEAGSLVEVTWPGPGGEMNCTAGTPRALEKKGGETILILNSENTAGETMGIPGNMIRIPLGKISLLRRIKQSIFEE